MKTLFLLLVCLAVSAAITSDSFEYNFKKFYVLPRPSCFYFRIGYCSAWFTTKYYSTVLKAYPGEKCLEDDFTVMVVDDYEAQVKQQLSEAAGKIYDELDKCRQDWEEKLNTRITDMKQEHERKVTECAEELKKLTTDEEKIGEIETCKNNAVEEYNKEIEEMQQKAVENYKESMQKRYQCVLDYHDRLVKCLVDCFNKRLTKIAEYREALEKRIEEYETRYRCVMEGIVKKRVAVFETLLSKAHCDDTWQVDDVKAVLEAFSKKETEAYEKQIEEYTTKLSSTIDDLVKYYGCAYQCGYSGALCFGRRSYYSYCNTLGAWWKYKITRSGCFSLCSYKFQYKPITYKKLATCNLDEVNITKEKLQEELDTRFKCVMSDLENKYDEWYERAKKSNEEALEKYKTIVKERHECLETYFKAKFLVEDKCITAQNEISLEDYQASLKEQEEKACKSFEELLEERLKRASDCYQARITCYRESLEKRITKLVTSYETCLSTREVKIENYEKCLRERYDSRINCFKERLNKIYELKIEQYKKLLQFYMGEPLDDAALRLYEAYEKKTSEERDELIEKMDGDWEERITCLKEHYSCGYKCNYCVTIPKITITYNYGCITPTPSCYQFGLKRFCTYRYYRIVHYGNCFQYVRCS